jgi:hypothetical protein
MSLPSSNQPGRPVMAPGVQASLGQAKPAAPKPASVDEDLGSISLIDEDPSGAEEIKVVGTGASISIRKDRYKREVNKTGTGAVRMRSFHGRLSAQGLEYLDNQINEWLDSHPEVEVKFVTSNVGTFEGKMREPALILNVWY